MRLWAMLSVVGVLLVQATAVRGESLLITGYTQNFNTLAVSGAANSTTPTDWVFVEMGSSGNTTYAANDGGSTTGNTYSYGTSTNTERTFGMLQSNALVPSIGAKFTNAAGGAIASLAIEYTGEQWRLGTAGRVTPDRLDFQYSLDATSLTTGTWVDVDALDFAAPVSVTVGAKDGNVAPNRTLLSNSFSVSIPNAATFWIRWRDLDVAGGEDGLAVDDFKITPTLQATPTVPTPSAIGGGLALLGVIATRRWRFDASVSSLD